MPLVVFVVDVAAALQQLEEMDICCLLVLQQWRGSAQLGGVLIRYDFMSATEKLKQMHRVK